jgi:hypothetical protein
VPCQQNPDLVLDTVVGVVEFQAQMPGRPCQNNQRDSRERRK